jgi:hypothetical protein
MEQLNGDLLYWGVFAPIYIAGFMAWSKWYFKQHAILRKLKGDN